MQNHFMPVQNPQSANKTKFAASSWDKPERVANQTNFIACMFAQEKIHTP